jgi:hypothetical protein
MTDPAGRSSPEPDVVWAKRWPGCSPTAGMPCTAVEELVYFVGRREARPEETVQPVTATPS